MPPRKRLFTDVTCTSWMLNQQRDLHLILKGMRWAVGDPSEREFVCPMANNLLPQVLDEWMRRELPTTTVGIVSKLVVNSKRYWEGWYVPYVDFEPHDLARYIEVWEGVDQRAIGANFRRSTFSYSKWHEELSNIKIFDRPPQLPTQVLWFDTPAGLLWCPWDRTGNCAVDAYKKEMIWLRVKAMFPSLVNASPQEIVSGMLLPDSRSKAAWICVVKSGDCRTKPTALELRSMYEFNGPQLTLRQRELCRFLGVDGGAVTFENSGWG